MALRRKSAVKASACSTDFIPEVASSDASVEWLAASAVSARKAKSRKLRNGLVAVSAMAMGVLVPSVARAVTITWDAGGGGGAITNGAGAWLTAGLWNNAGAAASWTSGDDAVFGGVATAGGAVTLASPTTVNSLTFNSFTGTYTLGTAANTITLNAGGINKTASSGAVTIVSPVTLAAAQSWTNNSAGLLTIGTGAVTNGGFLLTIGGTGNTTISSAISGAGGISKIGSGQLVLSGANPSFSGGVTINAGDVNSNVANSMGTGTVTIGDSTNTGLAASWSSSSGNVTYTNAISTTGTGTNSISVFGFNPVYSGAITLGSNLSVISNNTGGSTISSTGGVSGTGNLTIQSNAANTASSAITFSGTTLNFNGSITNSGTTTSTTLSNTTISSIIGPLVTSGGVSIIQNSTNSQLTLSGNNTYTGNVTITAGTLNVSGARVGAATSGALGNPTTAGRQVTIASAGTLNFNSSDVMGDGGSAPALTIIANGGTIRNNGLFLNSLGPVQLNGGTLTSTATGTNGFKPTGTITVGGSAVSTISGTGVFGSSSVITYDVADAVAGSGSDLNVSVVVGDQFGVGGINKTGAGTMTLSGANTYTGGTTVGVGTLRVGNATALGANASAVSVTAGAVLDVNGITMTGTNALALNGSGISTTGALVNTSATGAVYAGAITLNSASTIGNTSNTTIGNGNGGLRMLSTVNNNGNLLTFKGTGAISVANTGGISGGGAITVDGVYLNLFATPAANMTYGGTTTIQNGGAILQAVSNGIPTAGNIVLNGGYIDGYNNLGFVRALGTGAGQIQITGGVSGFGVYGSGNINLGGASATVQWNNVSGTFSPTQLILGTPGAATSVAGTTTFQNPIDLNGATRTITANGAAVNAGAISGVISTSTGTAGLIKDGAGRLNLTSGSANTYNGGTTVSAGILSVGSTSSLGQNVASNSAISVATGTSLYLSAAGNTGNLQTITLTSTAGNLSVLGLGYNGVPAAAISQTDTNGGLIAINAVTGYTGNLSTALTSKNLFLGAIGTSTFTGAVGTVVAGNGTTYRLGGGGGSISFNTANLITGANAVQIGSTATNGTGTVSFGASQNYTGNTAIASGSTLQITGASQLGTTPGTYNGDFSMAGGTLNYSSSANQTLGGNLTGAAGALTKAGAGILTLTGNNTFTGATTISAGTVVLNNDGDVTSSAVAFNTSNTGLTITGGSTVTSIWNNNGGTFGGVLGTSVNNVQVLIDGAGTAGSARLTNINALTWGNSNNTFTNSTITLTNGGQMNVSGNIGFGSNYYSSAGGANMTIGGGTATSTFTGNNQTFYIGEGSRSNANNNIVTVSNLGVLTNIGAMFVGDQNYTGTPIGSATANQLAVSGTGTASMASITVGNARVTATPNVNTANANLVNITSGGTLTTTSGTNSIGFASVAGAIANSNTLTVTGAGSTWNASNQNVNVGNAVASATSNNNVLTVGTGGVVSNVGTLTVGSGAGTRTGNQLVVNGTLTATTVTVNNILSGAGTINGAVTVTSGGKLSPGASVGTLTIAGSLNISAAVTASNSQSMQFEIGASGDQVVLSSGTLNIGSGVLEFNDFTFLDVGNIAPGTYTLFDSSTTITGTLGSTLSGTFFNGISGNIAFANSNQDIVLNVTVAPEPTSLTLLGLGGMGLLKRRRRR